MTDEVNKIIYNTLASGKDLYLTDIGSLVIERSGAKRHTKKFVEQPRKIIVFTEQQKGLSLEEEIARAGNIDAEQAHDIFEQWLMQTLDGDRLAIDGVGVLRRDEFSMADDFSEVLNRQGHERIAIKTRSNTALYIFASLCGLFALCVAGYVWIENRNGNIVLPFSQKSETADATVCELEENAQTVTDTNDNIADTTVETDNTDATITDDTEATAKSDMSTSEPDSDTAIQAEGQHPSDTIPPSVSGCSYVVLGIYSTPENAFRAVEQAKNRMADANCTVYRYGAKYMVSIYNSDNREQAVKYRDSISRSFKDLWVYTKK